MPKLDLHDTIMPVRQTTQARLIEHGLPEAHTQRVMAGINASLTIKGEQPLTLDLRHVVGARRRSAAFTPHISRTSVQKSDRVSFQSVALTNDVFKPIMTSTTTIVWIYRLPSLAITTPLYSRTIPSFFALIMSLPSPTRPPFR